MLCIYQQKQNTTQLQSASHVTQHGVCVSLPPSEGTQSSFPRSLQGSFVLLYTYQCDSSTKIVLSSVPINNTEASALTWSGMLSQSESTLTVVMESADNSTQVSSYPCSISVTFSSPVVTISASSFLYESCSPLSISTFTPSSYLLRVVPFSHSPFSISLPGNTVYSIDGVPNASASLTLTLTGGILHSSLVESAWRAATLSLLYDYHATAHCILTHNNTPPSTCALLAQHPSHQQLPLAQHPSHQQLPLAPNTPAFVTFHSLQLNSTYFSFCCAEEAFNVTMANSILSTRIQIDVDWLYCPMVGDLPCGGHGVCEDGESCQCHKGYYGGLCAKSCGGLVHVKEGVVECNGRGVCDPSERYRCV